jgi:hypothetical protein
MPRICGGVPGSRLNVGRLGSCFTAKFCTWRFSPSQRYLTGFQTDGLFLQIDRPLKRNAKYLQATTQEPEDEEVLDMEDDEVCIHVPS